MTYRDGMPIELGDKVRVEQPGATAFDAVVVEVGNPGGMNVVVQFFKGTPPREDYLGVKPEHLRKVS